MTIVGVIVAILMVPVFALLAGMFFGRKTAYQPEYAKADRADWMIKNGVDPSVLDFVEPK